MLFFRSFSQETMCLNKWEGRSWNNGRVQMLGKELRMGGKWLQTMLRKNEFEVTMPFIQGFNQNSIH